MKNKEYLMQHKQSGEIVRVYENHKYGFYYVNTIGSYNKDAIYGGIGRKFAMNDLRPWGEADKPYKFNPKDFKRIVKRTREVINHARKFAKERGLGFSLESPANGFGGYENGSQIVYPDIDGKITLICTCSNCGDGSWIDITKLI